MPLATFDGQSLVCGLLAAFALLTGVLIGAVFGLRRRDRRRRKSREPSPPRADDEYLDEGPPEELWDQLLATCYRSYPLQALAGRDPGLFQALNEPVYVAPEVVKHDSPLLPGELCLYEFDRLAECRRVWGERRGKFLKASDALDDADRALYAQLFDSALGALDALPEDSVLYWLSVRTPDHHHIILLSEDLREVVAIVPGLLALFDGA